MSNNKLVDPDIKKQIMDRVRGSGLSVPQIAREFGISSNTLYGWLRREISVAKVFTTILRWKLKIRSSNQRLKEYYLLIQVMAIVASLFT